MTLVEMMVASAIGTLVFIAIANLTVFTSRTFSAILNYTDMDQKSRYALDLMTTEIHHRDAVEIGTTVGSTARLSVALILVQVASHAVSEGSIGRVASQSTFSAAFRSAHDAQREHEARCPARADRSSPTAIAEIARLTSSQRSGPIAGLPMISLPEKVRMISDVELCENGIYNDRNIVEATLLIRVDWGSGS